MAIVLFLHAEIIRVSPSFSQHTGSALKDKNFILKFSETTMLYIPFRACPPWRRLGAKKRD